MNYKKYLPALMVLALSGFASAAETDFEAVGANISASIGLIGNVIDGIVSIVPNLIVILIMMAIAGFAAMFLKSIIHRIKLSQ